MTERGFRAGLVALYLAGGLLLSWQPFLAVLHPAYQGLLPYRGDDESMYMIRLQEALIDAGRDPSNGVWSFPAEPPGVQAAGMERFAGMLFAWTGWAAPEVALVITVVLAPLIMTFFALLARRAGIPPGPALLGALIYFIAIGLGRRYFHPSWSLPMTLAGWLLLWRWWDRPTRLRAVAAGLLLGILPAVYFWSWTFLWAAAGLLLVMLALTRASPAFGQRLRSAPLMILTGLLVGAPAFLRMHELGRHRFFDETSVRVGLTHARDIESPLRSFVLLFIAVATAIALRGRLDRERFAPLLAALAGLLVALNQQLVHGLLISFSSHYAFLIAAVTMLVALVFLTGRGWRSPWPVLATLCSFLFLAGVFLDYHGRLTIFLPPSNAAMQFQHLAEPLRRMRGGPRDVVLTDRHTANMVASVTNDDVVFTEYSGIPLIADDEYAERFCLSELFSAEEPPIEHLVVIDEARLRVLRGHETEERYRWRVAAVADACAEVRAAPRAFLSRYGVSRILWNERLRPDWSVDAKRFRLLERGEGWSLWLPRA